MKNTICFLVLGTVTGFLNGCGTSLPQRDLKPELAASRGYFVGAEEARARGGVGNYVPTICSDGGWGAPAKDCSVPSKAKEAVLPERQAAAPVVNPPVSTGQAVHGAVESKPALLKVYFASGKTELSSTEQKKVESFAKSFKEKNGELKLRGFADAKGNAAANQKLSSVRADSVAAALAKYGIKAGKSEKLGLGEVAGAVSATAAQEARRVEIFLE